MCPVINAASSGGSRFIVTSGLVETGNRCLRAGQPRWRLRYALDFRWRWQGEGGGGRLSAHPARQDRLADQPPFDARVVEICGPVIEMDRQIAIVRTRMVVAGKRAPANEFEDAAAVRD